MDIDRDELLKRTKAQIIDEMVAKTEEQSQEHERQLRGQVESIHRIMRGATDLDEIALLQGRIVELEKRLDVALEENRRLKGQPTSATNVGIKLRRFA